MMELLLAIFGVVSACLLGAAGALAIMVTSRAEELKERIVHRRSTPHEGLLIKRHSEHTGG